MTAALAIALAIASAESATAARAYDGGTGAALPSSANTARMYRVGELCPGSLAKCAGFSCSGAPTAVGDIVPDLVSRTRAARSYDATSIADVNAIVDRSHTAGWLYRAANGRAYIQFSYAHGPASEAFAAMFADRGYSASAVAGGDRYSGLYLWDRPWPRGFVARKCIAGGRLFAYAVNGRSTK